MKHIIRALIILVILYFVSNHFQYSPGINNLLNIFLLIASLYLVAAIVGAISKLFISMKGSTTATAPAAGKTTRSDWGCAWLFLIAVITAIVFYYRATVGSFSFKIFLFLDNLLKLTNAVSPLYLWATLGLFTGAVYGSFVAWKKYKLHPTINLIPIGILVLFVVILFKVNHPLNSTGYAFTANSQTEYAYGISRAAEYNSLQDENAGYKPAFSLDKNDNTAWITSVVKSGANEEIRFSFSSLQNYSDKHLQCVGFAIKNGYRKSPQLWSSFARAKTIAIRYNGRFITNAIVKDDDNGSEEIKINPIPVEAFDHVSITITAVYPGDKYAGRAAVSELVPIVEYDKY